MRCPVTIACRTSVATCVIMSIRANIAVRMSRLVPSAATICRRVK